MKTGFYLSLIILIVSLGVAFWPVLQTPRFWIATGIVTGMLGTFVFGVLLQSNKPENKKM